MRRLLAIPVAVIAVIGIGVGAMAASGQARLDGAAGLPPAAGSTSGICGEVTSVTSAVVHRTVAFPSNHSRFSFPAEVRIPSEAAAQGVARLLCALPAFPNGVRFCPIDLGIDYHIDFTLKVSSVSVVVNPGGCESVTGAISTRSAGSPSLWSGLGSAMGLNDATSATFAGSIRGL
jgi:hypothetical protein